MQRYAEDGEWPRLFSRFLSGCTGAGCAETARVPNYAGEVFAGAARVPNHAGAGFAGAARVPNHAGAGCAGAA